MAKPIIWTHHAEQNLAAREIERSTAEHTIRQPEKTIPEPPDRYINMRCYYDAVLEKEMLLRVVLAETDEAITVITVYKISQISRYLQ
jgi:hypothetical protein